MEKKIARLVILSSMITIVMTMPALAEWKSDKIGQWYQNDDKTYPANKWEWLDRSGDGMAECYYFDANGYLLTDNTAPDGFQVDANGAWTVNGVVQTKAVVNENTPLGYQREIGNEYVVKRISISRIKAVNGGSDVEVNDVTNMDMRDRAGWLNSIKKKDYKPDYTIFVPSETIMPDCTVIQVEIDEKTVMKATPVWVDSLEYTYGGFGRYYEDGAYISGRKEWGAYEFSDPSYALELQIQLTEEAKERAFELYPDMIVDYYVDPHVNNNK